MKTKIEFNEVYRPNIEAGEYKVETRDGRSVRIVAWDRKDESGYRHSILGLAFDSDTGCEEVIACNSNGKAPGPDKDDLFITWEKPELTEFQRVYLNKVHHLGEKDIQPSFLVINEVKENCDAMLDAAREQIVGELPVWKNIEAGVEYPTCLTREMDENGDWQYCISSGKIYDGCQYILLAELSLKLKCEESR